jgi:chromosome partitioning protein
MPAVVTRWSSGRALVVTEHAYIPIQASQFDVWTLSRVNDLVKTAKGFNSGFRAFIVLSRISPNPSVTERAEAEEVIKDFEQLELAQSIIRNRIAYRKAARDGLCVAELRPTDPDRLGHLGLTIVCTRKP